QGHEPRFRRCARALPCARCLLQEARYDAARALLADGAAAGMEGAAFLLVDDAAPASLPERKRLRPSPPARRARLCGDVARRRNDAGGELRRTADGLS